MRQLLVVLIVVGLVAMGGCAGMSETQQRTLTGGAAGTAGGALIGAMAGNAGLGASSTMEEHMHVKPRIRLFVMVFTAALVLFTVSAWEQDKPADTMQLVRDKIHADKKLFIADTMQLTEAEAKAFWPVYASYQK